MKLHFNTEDFNMTENIFETRGPFNLTTSSNKNEIDGQTVTIKKFIVPGNGSSIIEKYKFEIPSSLDELEYTFLSNTENMKSKRTYVTKASGPNFGKLYNTEVIQRELPTIGDVEILFLEQLK